MSDRWVQEHNSPESAWPDQPSNGACAGCGRYPRRPNRLDGDYCWDCWHGYTYADVVRGPHKPEYQISHDISIAVISAYVSLDASLTYEERLRDHRKRMVDLMGADAERLLWTIYDGLDGREGPSSAEMVAGLLWPAQQHEDELAALGERMGQWQED